MLIETVRTQLTETISPREIQEPLSTGATISTSRCWFPVLPTNTGSNQRFAETSAVPGQGISIAGQRNLYNSFIIDGVSANDDAADLTGTYYSEEVIDQFQVVTSGGIAVWSRFRRRSRHSARSRNEWRGSLYGFFRNQRFDARTSLAPTKDLLCTQVNGATVSGPLRNDRTFFR